MLDSSTSSTSKNELYWSPKSPFSLVIAICLVKPAPSESVLATMIPSSTPSSKNAYLTALILARKSA